MKDSEIIAILAKRDEAKAVRDWTVADKIRDELRARGIEVSRNDEIMELSVSKRGPHPRQQITNILIFFS